MVSNMQLTQVSGESDQQPIVKSNEIPNIPVSEVIQTSTLLSSESTTSETPKPNSTTLTAPVPTASKKGSAGAIRVNRFTINAAETVSENQENKAATNSDNENDDEVFT